MKKVLPIIILPILAIVVLIGGFVSFPRTTVEAAVGKVLTETYSEGGASFSLSYGSTAPDTYNSNPINVNEFVMIATIAYRGPNGGLDRVDSINYNGNGLNKICATADGEYGIEIWYINHPTPGDGYTLEATFNDEVDSRFVAVSFFADVDENNPIGDSICTNGEEKWVDPGGLGYELPNGEISSSTDSMVLSGVMSYSDSNTLTPSSASDTIEWNVFETNIVTSGFTVQGDTTMNVTWDMTSQWPWSMYAVSLNPSGTPVGDPEITITDTPPAVVDQSQTAFIAGYVFDPSWTTDTIAYELKDANTDASIDTGFADIVLVSGDYTDFEIDLENLVVKDYKVIITATNSIANTDVEEVLFEVYFPAPVCTLENLSYPTADTTPTYTGECDDTHGVAEMGFTVNKVGDPFAIAYTPIVSTTVGSYGDNHVEVAFTIPVSLSDGSYIITMGATNNLDASVEALDRASDFIVIEAVDNLPPRVVFNEMIPNPTVSTTPFLTGACRDNYQFELNSNVASIDYRIDGGSWTTIPALDGNFNSTSETFSTQIGPLAVGTYDIDIRCADTAGNSTEDNSSSPSQSLEVISPSGASPEIVSFNEDFSTQARNALAYTDAVWGNGIVRLRDTVTFDKVPLDTTGFAPRYDDLTSYSSYRMSEGTDDLVWYVKQDEFASYNRTSGVTTSYPGSTYGLSEFNDIAQVKAGNGDVLVWVSSRLGLLLLNVTTNTHTLYTTVNFWSPNHWPNRIATDTRDGRMGAYIRVETPLVGAFTTRLIYIDTNGTFNTLGDDTVRRFAPDGTIDTENAYHIMLDQDKDMLFVSTYQEGLGAIYDANDPTNAGNDQRSFIADAGSIVTDFAQDKANEALFVTDFDGSAIRIIDYSTAGSATTITGSTTTDLVLGSELGGYTLEHIEFLAGPQYIGGQLFIGTREGQVLYYNTNGSYHDSQDDNLIVLDTANFVYPLWISGIVVDDYNTLYVTLNRQGLYRLDLERSWESLNTAVAVAGPSEDKLFVNNISLESIEIIDRIDSDGVSAPSSVAPVTTYISVDDGVSWDPIATGETKFVPEDDYRVKFRMDLEENPGTTPVINQYSLTFASYQTVPADDDMIVAASPAAVAPGGAFAVSVNVVDQLGFSMTGYNSAFSLQLINAGTGLPAAGLTVTAAGLLDGEAIVPNAIANVGTYYIRISDGTYTRDTNLIVVSTTPVTPPVTPPATPPVTPPSSEDDDEQTGVGSDNQTDGGDDTTTEEEEGFAEEDFTPSPIFGGAPIVVPTSGGVEEDIEICYGETITLSDLQEIFSGLIRGETQVDFYRGTIFENTIIESLGRSLGLSGLLALIAGGLVGLNLLAFLSFVNSPSLLFNIFGFLVLRTRKKPWGIVYDALSGKPIAFAVCRLYLSGTTNLMTQTVSDLSGRFGLIISPGSYRLEVSQSGYVVYKEEINLAKNQVARIGDVPLYKHDLAVDEAAVRVFDGIWSWVKSTYRGISPYLFVFGFFFSILSMIFSPNIFNTIIFAAYLAVSLIYLYPVITGRNRRYASVVDSETGLRVPYAIVKIFNKKNWELVDSQSTNYNGKFDFWVDSADYALLVAKKGYKFPSKANKYPVAKEMYSSMIMVHLSKGQNKLKVLVDPAGYVGEAGQSGATGQVSQANRTGNSSATGQVTPLNTAGGESNLDSPFS